MTMNLSPTVHLPLDMNEDDWELVNWKGYFPGTEIQVESGVRVDVTFMVPKTVFQNIAAQFKLQSYYFEENPIVIDMITRERVISAIADGWAAGLFRIAPVLDSEQMFSSEVVMQNGSTLAQTLPIYENRSSPILYCPSSQSFDGHVPEPQLDYMPGCWVYTPLGLYFPITLMTPDSLEQHIAAKLGIGPYYLENQIIVVRSIDPENVHRAINGIWHRGYFRNKL